MRKEGRGGRRGEEGSRRKAQAKVPPSGIKNRSVYRKKGVK
jgi:hypothetical protein